MLLCIVTLYGVRKLITACLDLYFHTSIKLMQSYVATLPVIFTRSLTCTQAFPAFVAHLEKLAAAIQPLLDAPPVNILGVTTGSLGKRLAAAKTLMPVVKCGVLVDVESSVTKTNHSLCIHLLYSIWTKIRNVFQV